MDLVNMPLLKTPKLPSHKIIAQKVHIQIQKLKQSTEKKPLLDQSHDKIHCQWFLRPSPKCTQELYRQEEALSHDPVNESFLHDTADSVPVALCQLIRSVLRPIQGCFQRLTLASSMSSTSGLASPARNSQPTRSTNSISLL